MMLQEVEELQQVLAFKQRELRTGDFTLWSKPHYNATSGFLYNLQFKCSTANFEP